MWIHCVLIFLLPFVLLCTDQKYENYAYKDLYEFQANAFVATSFQFSANITHQLTNQLSPTLSSGIFIEQINNYKHQEKLLAFSMQHELIDRFLKNCTLEEFKVYITHHNIYTTKELVFQVEWWNYNVFWEYVESLADGHEEVVLFAQKFLKNYASSSKRALCWFAGTYKTGLCDIVTQKLKEHNARHHIKEEKRLQVKELLQQQYAAEQTQKVTKERQQHYAQQQYAVKHIQKVQRAQHTIIEDQYHAALGTMTSMIAEWQESDDQQLQERFAACNNHTHVFQEHTFSINKMQQRFLQKNQLNSDQWGCMYGSLLQKQLHTELLACIDDGIALHDDQLFVQTVDLAHQTNRAGLVAKASVLVDLCKAVVGGAAKGSVQGLRNAVYTKLHPIDTTINTIKAVGLIARCCAHAGSTAAKLVYYYAIDEQKYYTTMRDISDYNAAVCGVISDYFSKNDLPSIVYDATYLIAETVVSGRSMRLINGWGSRLTQKLAHYAQQGVTESPLVVIGLPGLKIKDAKVENAQFFERHRHNQKNGSSPSKSKSVVSRGQSIAHQVEKKVKEVLKAKNGDDFLDNTEFGKKLKPYCESMGGKKYNGELKYKIKGGFVHSHLEEGDIIYFDSLHKNHLEVFRKFDGKILQRYVINLDGMVNHILTDKVRAQRRILKW
jgi:hypothetical protein